MVEKVEIELKEVKPSISSESEGRMKVFVSFSEERVALSSTRGRFHLNLHYLIPLSLVGNSTLLEMIPIEFVQFPLIHPYLYHSTFLQSTLSLVDYLETPRRLNGERGKGVEKRKYEWEELDSSRV